VVALPAEPAGNGACYGDVCPRRGCCTWSCGTRTRRPSHDTCVTARRSRHCAGSKLGGSSFGDAVSSV
jgi:hypothetical protein